MSLTVPFEFYVTCATFGTESAMPSAWKLSAPFNNHVRLRTHSATTLSDGTRSNKQKRRFSSTQNSISCSHPNICQVSCFYTQHAVQQENLFREVSGFSV
jgi:hypothetical protein